MLSILASNVKAEESKYLTDDLDQQFAEEMDDDVKNIPSLEGTFQGWKVLTTKKNNKQVCYTVSFPFNKIGNHKSNREPYIMISYIGFKKQEVSISTGYEYRRNSKINVSVDGIQYALYARKYLAWSENEYADMKLIRTMLRGTKLMARAESIIGTYSVDMYSLDGFSEAYTKMLRLCQK